MHHGGGGEGEGVEAEVEFAGVVFTAAGGEGGGLRYALGAGDFVEAIEQEREPVGFCEGFGGGADFGNLFGEELCERLVGDPVAEGGEERERGLLIL